MNTQLFIPKKCKVGFNLRTDTYTGKLGYVIGQDGKKWRKEVSWNGWIQMPDKEIFVGYGKKADGSTNYDDRINKKLGDEVLPVEFDNVPTSGFVLNKKVGGYKSEWNMRQTYARVYDPRGFEFEINIANLLYILENANCMKGKGLEGEFIYSWDGKDLVLLPCDSWEYKKANDFTKLQVNKISAKEIKAGLSYKTKKEEDLVYVGRYMWYVTDWYKKKSREGKKQHIFYSQKNCGFTVKSDLSFLAVKNSEDPVPNFAEIIEKLKQDPRASDVVKCELIPGTFSDKTTKGYNGALSLEKQLYFQRHGDEIVQVQVQQHNVYESAGYSHTGKYVLKGFYVVKTKSFNEKTKKIQNYPYSYNSSYYGYDHPDKGPLYQTESLKKLDLCDLSVTLESGKEIKIDDLYKI